MSKNLKKKAHRVPASLRRRQLVDSTLKIIREKGVQAITLREIAAEAKASLASVHYCFSDKEELLQAAVEHWLRTMVTDSINLETSFGVRDAVNQMITSFWEGLEEGPNDLIAQFEVTLWTARESSSIAFARSIYPMYVEEMSAALARSMEMSGETCICDLDRFSRALLCIIDGSGMQYLSDPTANARELCFDLVEILLEQAKITKH